VEKNIHWTILVLQKNNVSCAPASAGVGILHRCGDTW